MAKMRNGMPFGAGYLRSESDERLRIDVDDDSSGFNNIL